MLRLVPARAFRLGRSAESIYSECGARCDFSRWISARAVQMSRRNRERVCTQTYSKLESHSRKGLM